MKAIIFNLLLNIIRFVQYGDLPTSYYTKKGMIVGKNFNRQSESKFDPSHCWLISIGDNVTVGNKVTILAHDDSTRLYTNYGRIGKVIIGNNVFIGAGTIILANSRIGDDVIIGAGSVVKGNIPNNSVIAGVPARIICKTSDYIDKCKSEIGNKPTFDLSYTIYDKRNFNKYKKNEMNNKLINTDGYQLLWLFKDNK